MDTVIVEARHAGLASSQRLAEIEHVVLERGRIGQTWRTQRWTSFTLRMGGRARWHRLHRSAVAHEARLGDHPWHHHAETLSRRIEAGAHSPA